MTIESTDCPDVERLRLQLRRRADTCFLDRDAFLALLISPRRLRRSDDPGARVRGLLDLDEGIRFVIEEEALHASKLSTC